MKSTSLFVLLSVFVLFVSGCTESTTAKRGKSEKEPPRPRYFPERNHWLTSWKEATKQSKETGKPIFALFTGSDWCRWCQVLDAEILNTVEFSNWAKENLVLLEVDFPRNKKLPPEVEIQNHRLARDHFKEGQLSFPTIVVMDHEGKHLVVTGYHNVSAEAYVTKLDENICKALAESTSKTSE